MKPKRILLIRHGESEGNCDKSIYSKKPDYAVMLTDKGIEQAAEAGRKINTLIQNESWGVYYSPYFRARQTMDVALKQLNGNSVRFKREEPRIREQEYCGNLKVDYVKHHDESDRESYGKFFYRMDGGESGADVFDRESDFIGTLYRDFEKNDYPENCLIFGHGFGNRIFLMRFFHIEIEEFEYWKNPKNGELYILELGIDDRYKLITPIEKYPTGYGWKYPTI